MKIYVSTPSRDLEVARQRMEAIRAMGHEVTFDWTASFGDDVPKDAWPQEAEKDIAAVKEADCMVLFGAPTAGCFVEFGAAIASGVPVLWLFGLTAEFDNRHFFLYHDILWAIYDMEELELMLKFLDACMKRANHQP